MKSKTKSSQGCCKPKTIYWPTDKLKELQTEFLEINICALLSNLPFKTTFLTVWQVRHVVSWLGKFHFSFNSTSCSLLSSLLSCFGENISIWPWSSCSRSSQSLASLWYSWVIKFWYKTISSNWKQTSRRGDRCWDDPRQQFPISKFYCIKICSAKQGWSRR